VAHSRWEQSWLLHPQTPAQSVQQPQAIMQATTYLKNALSRREKCIGFWLT
jgi:hypothetical protein